MLGSSSLINIGLVADIIGAGLLYCFGLGQSLIAGGGTGPLLIRTDNSASETEMLADAERRYRRHKRGSMWGIGLLGAGFALQLLGNLL